MYVQICMIVSPFLRTSRRWRAGAQGCEPERITITLDTFVRTTSGGRGGEGLENVAMRHVVILLKNSLEFLNYKW